MPCNGHCPWYYRGAGIWCPEHKHLYRYGTEEYEELLDLTSDVYRGQFL